MYVDQRYTVQHLGKQYKNLCVKIFLHVMFFAARLFKGHLRVFTARSAIFVYCSTLFHLPHLSVPEDAGIELRTFSYFCIDS